ncbi:MAG: cytochrome c biogenesis CcdA family protein [Chloroflexota bacterium]
MKNRSMILACALGLVLAMLLLSLPAMDTATAQSATVHFFFFTNDSADCQIVQDELLASLTARYGDQIAISYLNVANEQVLQQRLILEQWHGVLSPSPDTPEVYIADQLLVGVDEIRSQLPDLIAHYLSQGGVDLPPLPTPPGVDLGKPVVRFLLFYGDTCPHCHQLISQDLPPLFRQYGQQLQAQYLEIYHNAANSRIMQGLLLQRDVPPEQFGYVPTLIIGENVLIGGNTAETLKTLIEHYLAEGGVDYPPLENLPQPVSVLVFFDPSDEDMTASLQNFFTPLIQQFGNWLRIYGSDLVQDAATLAQYNAVLGIPQPPAGTPQALIGRQMLVGLPEIEKELPDLIAHYRQQMGVGILSPEELAGQAATATPSSEPAPSPTTEAPTPQAPPIYVAYFDQAGCQECARTTNDLQQVQQQYPQLVVENFAIEDHKALNEWLCQRLGVPEAKRLSTPMVIIGTDVLIGSEANLSNLMFTVAQYTASGAGRTWTDFDQEQAQTSLLNRFESFGLLTVLGAGLIDGLNPCAFATLVFFISYLTFTGRRGRDVLLVGGAFALGVFLTYLTVGVGLLKAVQALPFFTALGKWVYLVTALLCVLLATLTFRDFFKARQGQTSEMTLRLPMSLRRRIHRVIREGAQLRAYVAVALVTGFIVSLLELACTGQVYLPTILFVLSVPEMAAQAFLYLLLYCLMFTAPLIVVFVLSYLGTTSEQLGQFVNRHTATVKLLTGLLFVALALWMTWTLTPLFSVQTPWNWVATGAAGAVVAVGATALVLTDRAAINRPKQPKRRRAAR